MVWSANVKLLTQLKLKFSQIFIGRDRIITNLMIISLITYQRNCFLGIRKQDKSTFLKNICSCENKGSFVTFPTFGYN